MKARLQKRNKSVGIRILDNIFKTLEFKTNNKANLSYSENKISLEERFLNYNGENLAKEFSWDVPQGKELW